MSDFRASNGVAVSRDQDGRVRTTFSSIRSDIVPSRAAALAEFFEHDKDESFGRWRAPRPLREFVVYPGSDFDTALVLHEPSGAMTTIARQEVDDAEAEGFSDEAKVARQYFIEADKTRRWQDSVEGELWALRFGVDPEEIVVVRRGDHFAAVDTNEYFTSVGVTAPEITGGRRVWPEVQA
ncbi:hypothetical protein Q9R08_04985 [Microbacterium sp. QXD-8]|uniref:Uncharacterized protein n=1 Tax=Microbacterium psychrotolerans TaxID=3068321 RepID=A0ABU0YYC9_9MICO|nr:hypothetical protein [Microbacterium sp. QXD-8]MDQ7877327.1 hypothetical protein [Microbacterium sp. QXD-8]